VLLLPIAGIPLALASFSTLFRSAFSRQIQYQHFQEMLAGLIVSENKTVAGIHQGLLLNDNGYDSLRKFMSRSPWSVEDVKEQRLQYVKEQVVVKSGDVVTVPIDGTLLPHSGETIHGVYWYFDYAKKAYKLGQRIVLSTYATPTAQVPLGRRLYHRAYLDEQKQFLDATKPGDEASEEEKRQYADLVKAYEENSRKHKKQPQLAEELVDECEQYGFKKDAYVLDAALLTPELAEKIEQHNQAWVSRLAKSRLVQATGSRYERLDAFAKSLPKGAFKKIEVVTRGGEKHTYWVFSKCVKVKNWQKVRIVISYDNEELDGEPIFIVTNKLNWTQPKKVVQIYTYRDPIEHCIRDEKQELGFEDCQLQGQEAVEKNWELSFVAHTFLQLGFKVDLPPALQNLGPDTIGQRSRLMEREIMQGFVQLVQDWILEKRDTKELVDIIMAKRLNGLAS
jgi:SRSO17 transposase